MSQTRTEGPELKALIRAAKKKPIQFAFNPAKTVEEYYFLLHKKKTPKILGKIAKAEGVGKKVSYGTCEITGKILTLSCERQLAMMAKKVKKYLKVNGVNLNVQIADENGNIIDSVIDEDTLDDSELAGNEAGEADTEARPNEAEAPAEDELKERSLEAVKSLQTKLQALSSDEMKKFAKLYKGLVEAHKAGNYTAVIKAGPKLDAAINQVQATSDSTGSGDDTAEVLTARIDAELKVLTPGLKNILTRLPSLKKDITQLITAARSGAASGDENGASTALNRLKTVIEKVEQQKQDAGQGAADVSVMKLGKARLEWVGVREAALADVTKLQSRIRSAFASQPDLGKAVEAGIARLDKAINKISDDLSRALDLVLKESDAEARASKAQDVAGMTRSFVNMITTDPVISAIDGTVYMPEVSVVAPLKKSLADVLGALGQAATTTE